MRHNRIDTLYVLGNGFDICHHSAPWNADKKAFMTSYSDFKSHCQKGYPILYRVLSESLDKEWNTFEEGLGTISFDTIYKESGISRFSSFVDKFTDQLRDAFEEWINQVVITKGRCWKIKRKNRAFLSFNYTKTLQKCYSIADSAILQIHGWCFDQQAPYLKPVFGHNLTDEEIKNKSSHVDIDYRGDYSDFLRWLQKDTFSTLADVQNQLFFNKLRDVQEVYFYGFSFGKVDYPYIDYIYKLLPSAKYYIAYHSDTDINNINCYLTHNPDLKINAKTVKDSEYKTVIYKLCSHLNMIKELMPRCH